MKFIYLISILSFACSADIPVDTLGKMLEPSINLEITNTQAQKISKTGILVFNGKQLSILRKEHKNFLDSIRVITPFHPGGLGGMVYAVWSSEGLVAIPRSCISLLNENTSEVFFFNRKLSEGLENYSELYVDLYGDIYFHGRNVSFLWLQNQLTARSQDSIQLFVIRPPKTNDIREKRVIKSIEVFLSLSSKLGIKVILSSY
jgi:hypothetical protein